MDEIRKVIREEITQALNEQNGQTEWDNQFDRAIDNAGGGIHFDAMSGTIRYEIKNGEYELTTGDEHIDWRNGKIFCTLWEARGGAILNITIPLRGDKSGDGKNDAQTVINSFESYVDNHAIQ